MNTPKHTYKQWSIYLIAIPVFIVFITSLNYLVSGYQTIQGSYPFSFMFGGNSTPIPWFMKTEELFIQYSFTYSASLLILVLKYIFAVLKNKKRIQILLGIMTILFFVYEFKIFTDSLP